MVKTRSSSKKGSEEKSSVEKTLGGYFKLRGQVTKIIDNGGKGDTFTHSVISNGGKYDGSPTIGARISLTTRLEDNVRNDVDLRLFAMKADTMMVYDNQEKETLTIPYEDWEEYLEVKDEDKRNRYSILNSIRLKVEEEPVLDEKGNPVLDEDGEEVYELVKEVRTYPTYEALEILEEVLEKGRGLFVQGRMEFRSGTNREGETVVYKQLTPTAIFSADVDFEAEDFEEVNEWNQQMYIVKTQDDSKTNKLKITGRIVNKDLDWVDTEFVIPYGDMPELEAYADSVESEVEYGDLVYFGGHFRRGAKQVTQRKSKFSGGKTHTASAGYGELEYVTDGTYTDTKCEEDLQKNKATKRDFELIKKSKEKNLGEEKEAVSDEPKRSKSSFGRAKAKTASKFEEESIDIDDDDLPF